MESDPIILLTKGRYKILENDLFYSLTHFFDLNINVISEILEKDNLFKFFNY